jgi:hypothetical protein
MPIFRDHEKKRLVPLKPLLFSSEACEPGLYRHHMRDFALFPPRAAENLWGGIRTQVLQYFDARKICWHDGIAQEIESVREGGPSNHLCCSQTSCANFWFPFTRAPDLLADVLRGIDYDVAEVLPISLDQRLPDGRLPYVGFEWIGRRNYLAEGPDGHAAPDGDRTRGKNATSADIVVRFRDSRGRIHVVLGEWKYTEEYANDRSLRVSDSGADRLATYAPFLAAPDCQIQLDGLDAAHLFYDPFDELMRLQLLASAMEREHEMDADIVSTLHMAPAANEALMHTITSPKLRDLGSDIHHVWNALVPDERFRGVYVEDLESVMLSHPPHPQWRSYIGLRYGAGATSAQND